ncbi:MAG TPA: ATP-binding cassette domain-containing protein [Actinomycetaceae bacterium]|nr:ATP-binding cassette domain-containing protein [Actinomycetaceae bacterium]
MSDLKLDGLSKKFGNVVALDGLSLTVHDGELYGFVGSNGAGKTTAMRIVLGVLSRDAGEVTYGGKPIDFEIRRQIGYMPEERGLYPKMKVDEHLVYLARLHGMDAPEAKASMEAWTDRLGVGHRRHDTVDKLSLGNQQRVQLSAALVHNPRILVLDEPFSGLDPVAVEVMSGVLRDTAASGVPVIFSSHQLDLVERLCDRVGIIKDGRIVAEGTIEDLRVTDTARMRIRVDGARPGWLAGVPNVREISRDDGEVVVEFASGDITAEQALLKAATDAGMLREFARERPRLQDLFRHVVSTSEEVAA